MSNSSPLAPRVGAGAFITDADGRLLLIKRRREPEAGHWGLPGGKVEFGETLAETVAREVLEEVGLVVRVGELICIIDHIERDAGVHWVAPTYRAALLEGEAVNREPHALEAVAWFDLDALPSPLTQAVRRCLQIVAGAI